MLFFVCVYMTLIYFPDSTGISSNSVERYHLRQLCKFCDNLTSPCKLKEPNCESNCTTTAICPKDGDVCVGIW